MSGSNSSGGVGDTDRPGGPGGPGGSDRPGGSDGPGMGPRKPKPTMARYALWIIVGGLGLVFVIQGLVGILNGP